MKLLKKVIHFLYEKNYSQSYLTLLGWAHVMVRCSTHDIRRSVNDSIQE
jgi:hypothetical protein